jgi:hypothetical protein
MPRLVRRKSSNGEKEQGPVCHDGAGFAGDRLAMRRAAISRITAAALVVAICAGLLPYVAPAARAADPARPYLGMSKEEIIACAGEPYARYKSGPDAETLTYHYSGAGPVPTPPSEKKKKDKPGFALGGDKKKKDKGWSCTASLVFEGGRLARVNFAHKDVRSPYQWQSEKKPEKAEAMRKESVPTCGFSLPNCARQ